MEMLSGSLNPTQINYQRVPA